MSQHNFPGTQQLRFGDPGSQYPLAFWLPTLEPIAAGLYWVDYDSPRKGPLAGPTVREIDPLQVADQVVRATDLRDVDPRVRVANYRGVRTGSPSVLLQRFDALLNNLVPEGAAVPGDACDRDGRKGALCQAYVFVPVVVMCLGKAEAQDAAHARFVKSQATVGLFRPFGFQRRALKAAVAARLPQLVAAVRHIMRRAEQVEGVGKNPTCRWVDGRDEVRVLLRWRRGLAGWLEAPLLGVPVRVEVSSERLTWRLRLDARGVDGGRDETRMMLLRESRQAALAAVGAARTSWEYGAWPDLERLRQEDRGRALLGVLRGPAVDTVRNQAVMSAFKALELFQRATPSRVVPDHRSLYTDAHVLLWVGLHLHMWNLFGFRPAK